MSLPAQLAATVVAAQVYTLVWSALASHELFRGSPLFNWYSCLPVQLLVLPGIVLLALRGHVASPPAAAEAATAPSKHPPRRRSVWDWVLSSWNEGVPGRPMDHMFVRGRVCACVHVCVCGESVAVCLRACAPRSRGLSSRACVDNFHSCWRSLTHRYLLVLIGYLAKDFSVPMDLWCVVFCAATNSWHARAAAFFV